jgi:hypothetical protein
MIVADMQEAVAESSRLISEYGAFHIEIERYVEREPHPKGQEAFTIRVKFPWYPEPLCRIKIEITYDEPVLLKPLKQKLIHGYEESLNASIYCYCLDVTIGLNVYQKHHLKVYHFHRNKFTIIQFVINYFFIKLEFSLVFLLILFLYAFGGFFLFHNFHWRLMEMRQQLYPLCHKLYIFLFYLL